MQKLIKIIKKNFVISVFIALFWLSVWQLLSLIVNKAVLLPSPIATAKTLFTMIQTGSFWLSCVYTFGRIALGFLAGAVSGTIIGFLCFRWSIFKKLLHPIQAMIKATPVASFIILALVWIGKNSIPSFTSFLMVVPIMWSGVYSSLTSIDKNLTEAMTVFPLTLKQRIKYVYFPLMKKKYTASLETCLGLAWKAGIAAEVLCMPKRSMGTELYNSKVYIETENLFAWTFCIIVISILLEFIMKKVFIMLFPEKEDSDGTADT